MAASTPATFPSLGADVLVSSKYRATVRFIGATDFAAGVWVGLELEKPIGKHEGTVLDRTYFRTAPKHATFVRPADVSPFDPAVVAAAAIQSASRAAAAKKRVASEAATSAFNKLDADAEARQMLRQTRLLATPLGKALARERPTGAMVDAWDAAASAVPVEREYAGPRVAFPLTAPAVVELMRFFRDGGSLPYRYALSIVAAFRRWAAAMPTLVEHAIAHGERVVVVGDTHGQVRERGGARARAALRDIITTIPAPASRPRSSMTSFTSLASTDYRRRRIACVRESSAQCASVFHSLTRAHPNIRAASAVRLQRRLCRPRGVQRRGHAVRQRARAGAAARRAHSSHRPPHPTSTVMAWCLVTQGAVVNGRLLGSACFAQRGNHESHSQNLAGGFSASRRRARARECAVRTRSRDAPPPAFTPSHSGGGFCKVRRPRRRR